MYPSVASKATWIVNISLTFYVCIPAILDSDQSSMMSFGTSLDYCYFAYWILHYPNKFLFSLQDGCIVCPTTDSTFDLQTGDIKEWYPKNPVLRVLTPALRKLFVYPVKLDGQNIYISMRGGSRGSAEIVFSGRAQPGVTASDVNVEEVYVFHLSFTFIFF